MSIASSYGLKCSVDYSRPRWEQWPGNHSFFCDGRIMLGPNACHLLITALLALFLWCSQFFLIIPFLPIISSSSAGWSGAACVWKFWVPLALFLLNESLMMFTALVEPGIIPQCPPQLITLSLAQELRAYSRTSFCSVCQLVRPPRSRHCRYCGCCVSELDHHCPWVGTCIGKRNYPFFFSFVTSVVISSLYLLLNTIWVCLAQAEIYVGILGDTRAAYIGVDSAAVTGTVYASLYEEIASGFNLDASDVLHENVAGWRTVAVIWGSLWSLLLVCFAGSLLGFHIYLVRNSLTTAEYLKPNPTVTRYTTSGNTPSNNTLSLATVNSRGKGSVVERREQPSNSQITHSPKRVGSLSPILPAHLSHDGHPFNSSSAIPMYRSYPELSKLERELLTERGDKDTERDRDLDNSTHSNLSNASTATPLALDLYASAANLADPTYTYSSRGKGMAVTATSEDLLGHVVNEDDDDDNNTKNHENKNKKGNTGGSSSSSSSSGDTLHTCNSNSNTIDIGKRRPHSAASSFGEWSKEDANRRMYGRLPTNESKVDRTEKNGDADNNNGKGKGKSRSRRKGVVNRVDDRWSDRNNNGNDVDNDDELDCELAEDELSDSSDDEEENDGEQRRRSIDYEENGDSGDGDNDSEGNSDIFRVTSASAGTGTAIGMDKFASTSASCLTAMCCVPPSALPLMHMHPNKEDKNLATTRTRAVVRQLKDLLAEFRLQAQGQAQVCQQGSEEGHADTKEK